MADDGNADNGAKLFKAKCSTCHTCNEGGPNKQGPNLFGVIGRQSGQVSGFKYTSANKNSNITWTNQTLFECVPALARVRTGEYMQATAPGAARTDAGCAPSALGTPAFRAALCVRGAAAIRARQGLDHPILCCVAFRTCQSLTVPTFLFGCPAGTWRTRRSTSRVPTWPSPASRRRRTAPTSSRT